MLGGGVLNTSVTDLLQRGREGYKISENDVMRFMDSPLATVNKYLFIRMLYSISNSVFLFQ